VGFNKATEGMGRGRVANARWERVPHSGGCNTETAGSKCSRYVVCELVMKLVLKSDVCFSRVVSTQFIV